MSTASSNKIIDLHTLFEPSTQGPGEHPKTPEILPPAPIKVKKTGVEWSWREESNPRPADYKSAALPTELRQPNPDL